MFLNYHNNTSKLCEIGALYDTDKSSQRKNVTNQRHCHPYTLFYDSLFKNYNKNEYNIAELGILDGASLLMWEVYFPNSKLYGFEYNTDLINNFKKNFQSNAILTEVNVNYPESISSAFESINKVYDIIIEDTTHQFADQIRVIQNVTKYLKPGGVLIIEDIFKHYNEKDYIDALGELLNEYQKYYFVTLDHVNRNSTGWDNDKLFVLVKKGPEIFKNNHKITIITPSCRPSNLPKVKDSINFDYVDQWIIVYDGLKVHNNPNQFPDNPKIKEFIHTSEGISGNPQRNYALDQLNEETGYLYFLDDDNIIHPDLYKLLDIVDDDKVYSFNQSRNGGVLYGNKLELKSVDTAMVLIHNKLCNGLKWISNLYDADGHYIQNIYNNNKDKWMYVDNSLCYYNNLL